MIQAQVEAFNQFTKTIAINGLEQYVMYIGSWAEFIYLFPPKDKSGEKGGRRDAEFFRK